MRFVTTQQNGQNAENLVVYWFDVKSSIAFNKNLLSTRKTAKCHARVAKHVNVEKGECVKDV